MNKKKSASLAVAASVLLSASGGCSANDKTALPAEYAWSNAAMGGGGYITGIVYNPSEEGLAYVRTDIGGAYRFSSSDNRWIPITDHLGLDEWNLIGIESIATDPAEPNRVYAACGTYMDKCSAILSSDDYGNSWHRYDAEFGCGSNTSGRGVGERLKVDPAHNNNVYFGSRCDGLWKSEDYGISWHKVESFPVCGDYSQEGCSIGIMWVEFDPVTDDIYAAAAMTDGNCIYRSCDGGMSWEALPPVTAGFLPLRAAVSPNGHIYMACSDTAGPNVDPKNGAVLDLCIDTLNYTNITPDVNDGHYGGYGGIALSADEPDTLVVSSLGYWNDNGDNIYRSTDGGRSWNALYTYDEKNYVMDTRDAQWLDWGRTEAKTGWWISALAVDPFNHDEVTYGTGAALFSACNMSFLGSGTPVTIKFSAYGIEETAVYDIAAPPTDGSSPQLYSIMGDLTGFAHLDVSEIPDDAHFMKNGRPHSLSCAWQNGNFAAYTSDSAQHLTYTDDGGSTWKAIDDLPEKTADGGTVTVSCDGNTVIWRASKVSRDTYVTPDLGGSWFYCQGLKSGAVIIADKLDPKTFYAVCDGKFLVSEDGGYYFNPTDAAVPDDAVPYAVGDKKGHVWLVSKSGTVMVTGDGGKSFSTLKNITADAVGFGAPMREGGCMTAFAVRCDDRNGGIFRSDDGGSSWQRINDDLHLFGNVTPVITGDCNIAGRVYIATNGRGIIIGDIAE